MKIRMLWERADDFDDCAWLVAAIDEYSDDAGGSDEYEAALKMNTDKRRELVLEIPDKAVYDLFTAPVVKAKVLK